MLRFQVKNHPVQIQIKIHIHIQIQIIVHWWSVNNRQRHDGSLPRSWPSLNPTWPPLHRGSFASYALARYDKYCTRYKLRRVLHFTSNKKWFPWPHVNVIFNWHNKKKHQITNSKVKIGPCTQFDGNIIWCKQGQIHLLIVQRYWSALHNVHFG